MQHANKAWSRNVNIYRRKDVTWRMKCRSMVDRVHSAFCFGSEHSSWNQAVLDGIGGWETKP